MRHLIATIVLGPVLLVQGIFVRLTVPKLPEAPGAREGVTGSGMPLRVLIVGDSSAAGVGAASQSKAFSGWLISSLISEFTVHWKLLAQTGSKTLETINRLENYPSEQFDVVVTALGVNDVTAGICVRSWLNHQISLVKWLRDKFSTQHILLSGLPPVHRFPSLPQPLRWYLGNQARRFDIALRTWVETQQDCDFVKINFALDPELMAPDGFHPGPIIYGLWGKAVAQKILESRLSKSQMHHKRISSDPIVDYH